MDNLNLGSTSETDDLRQLNEQVVQRGLAMLAIVPTVAIVGGLIFSPGTTQPLLIIPLVIIWLLALLPKIPYLLRVGVLVTIALVLGTASLSKTGLVGSARSYFLAAIIIALVFVGGRVAKVILAVTITAALSVGFLVFAGYIPLSAEAQAFLLTEAGWRQENIRLIVQITLLGGIVLNAVQNAQHLLIRQQRLTKTVRDARARLAERVKERTLALSLTAEVSQTLNTILDQEQLISSVVSLIQRTFRYYHVQIYLFDERQDRLTLAGGTGEAGKRMLQEEHFVSFGRGLVGLAGGMRVPIVVPNVALDSNWIPNPHLPETKAEIAVPIQLGDACLGVLDVQHHLVDGLTESDVDLLVTLANQIAIALQNAAIYSNLRQGALRERLLIDIGQQIQLTADVETAMQTAVRELSKVQPAKRISISLDGAKLQNQLLGAEQEGQHA